MTQTVHFIERQPGESLAMHLHRNAEVLGADREQRANLRRAAALSLGDRDQRIEAGLVAEAVRKELNAMLDTVVYAAQARGEKVVAFNDAGAQRVKTRDGLWSMFESNSLTLAQFEIGLNLRALAEASGLSIGSQLGATGEGSPGRSSTDAMVRHGLQQAYAGVRVTEAERAVRFGMVGGRGLLVLRAVAVEGRTVGSLSTSGHERKQLTKALADALDIVGVSLAATGGLRITGS
jgi:hypothetical protein